MEAPTLISDPRKTNLIVKPSSTYYESIAKHIHSWFYCQDFEVELWRRTNVICNPNTNDQKCRGVWCEAGECCGVRHMASVKPYSHLLRESECVCVAIGDRGCIRQLFTVVNSLFSELLTRQTTSTLQFPATSNL